MNYFLETSELKAVTVYKFTCPTCKNSLTVSKPFEIHFCPFCAMPLDEYYAKNSNKKRKSKKPVKSCKNCFYSDLWYYACCDRCNNKNRFRAR